MTRLIDADALKKAFEDCTGECACCIHNTNDFNYCGLIDDAPTVEERTQGEWGPCYENYKNGMFYRDCSICGKATMTGDWKFCPYCGAEMKGGT